MRALHKRLGHPLDHPTPLAAARAPPKRSSRRQPPSRSSPSATRWSTTTAIPGAPGFFQLTRITRDKGALAKDDRLDALAMAVAYWSKSPSVENAKVVQANRDKLMQRELERYLQHAIGRKPTGSRCAPTIHRRLSCRIFEPSEETNSDERF